MGKYIVTIHRDMEDVIETIPGLEIVDERDTIADLRKYARSPWERRKRKRTWQ